jgi:hypothetical protein
MLDVLGVGRVLVDRDGLWARVRAGARRWRRVAAEEGQLEGSLQDLEL